MAKARMLSQAACDDAKLNRLSVESELLYLLTLPHLDRDGLVDGRPSWLAGHCMSERPELHTRVGSFVEEWVTQGLVTRYAGGDGPVLFFHGFRKHNSNLDYRREPESKFPPPPHYIHGDDGLLPLNPKLARTIAYAFDKRNSYRIALLIHADRLAGKEAAGKDAADEIIEQALGKSEPAIDLHKDSGESHRKVTGDSDESHRLIEVNTIQDQENGMEENTNTNARALLTFTCRLLMPEWNGGDDFLATLNDEDLKIAANWLWLYQKLKGQGEYSVNEYAARYKPSPFDGIANPPGFIRRKIEKHEPVKLYFDHRAEFDAELRELKEIVKS